ncbi:hypothetical protein VTO73DRAFT_7881 [Trametes versicolor]
MPLPRPLIPNKPFQRPFPLEIFLVIRNTIPLGDIRTHVCFYKTHPRITAMYDSEKDDDDFWRRVCWHSGIGALDKDDLAHPHCWRGIALELVEKDGFCKHPRCGEGLLEYNSRRMERVASWFKPLTVFSDWKEDLYTASDSETEEAATGAHMDVDNKEGDDEKDDRPPHLIPHRVLTGIEFRDRPWGGYYGVREDAQLRAEEAYGGSALLHDHLLVQRSFATDIPVDGICVGEMGGHEFRRENVTRRTGVTVLDVMTTIHADLDIPLTDYEQSQLVDHLNCTFSSNGLSEDDVYARFHTLRDTLNECHISEFYYDGTIINGAPMLIPNLQED